MNAQLQATPKRTALTWLFVVAFIAFCGFTLMLFAQARAARKKVVPVSKPSPSITVGVTRAEMRALPDTVLATGTVSAVDPLAVGAELNGLRVQEVAVEEGDSVRRGQVLATLNRSVLQAQLSQAQARYQAGQAQISKAVNPMRSEDVNGLQAALDQAKSAVAQEKANLRQAQTTLSHARDTYARYQKVLAEGFVTIQEADDRRAEVDRNQQSVLAAQDRVRAADFAVEQARQRLLMAHNGGRAEDVSVARASSLETAGVIEQLEAQLEQTVIRAPDDGLITRRDVHIGEISSSAKTFFTIARRGELEMKAEVPQADLLRLRSGLRAEVVFSGKKTPGKIWQLSPSVDPNTRLGFARILLEPVAGLKVGMFAQASLNLGQRRALTLPLAAVLGEGGEYYVFKVEDGKAVKQAVKTGIRTTQLAEILEGLKVDDPVVLEGAGFLSSGDPIKVK